VANIDGSVSKLLEVREELARIRRQAAATTESAAQAERAIRDAEVSPPVEDSSTVASNDPASEWSRALAPLAAYVEKVGAEVDRLIENMREAATKGLEETNAVLEEIKKAQEEAEAQRDWLENIRDTADDVLNPQAGTEGGRRSGRLRGIEAVRAVLEEEPDRVWRPKDVHAVLQDRGWLSGAKSGIALTEGAINRLWKKTEEVERVAKGRYRWKGGASERPRS
jgi:chromosome segregation ATPase